MSGIYGVATINTQNHERLVVTEGDIAPDYLTWDDKGGHVGFYVNEESDVSDTGFAPSNEEIKIPTHHFQYFDVTTGKPDFNIESQSIDGRLRFSTFDEEMEMEMEFDRGRIIAPNFLGNETMVLERTNENDEMERITFKAEQIRSRSENGIVFVNTDWPVMHLFATNGSGEPKLISGGASILYYIPMPKGSTTTFVQVGQSYSGSGCKVSSHTSSSSMKYAIDMQLSSTSSYDQVDASGVGTTYNSSDVTSCNYGDTSGCAANTSTCSKSFGNWVIISHADGYYTLYGHMEMGTTKPTTCGTAVAAGCWLGDQGFTGWTEGNNYDTSFGTTYKCGDHLHFQLQNGGSTSSSSVSVGFSEDGSITSSDCTSKTPSKSKATCSL
ncbi:MAG: M23 family metallopeptidase [Candidatus Yonathbacteria bacterium]|nr:M23 family metallopeptidase [Candidatus Yonathbacteria bacterium]